MMIIQWDSGPFWTKNVQKKIVGNYTENVNFLSIIFADYPATFQYQLGCDAIQKIVKIGHKIETFSEPEILNTNIFAPFKFKMPQYTIVLGSLYCENPENGACTRGRKFQGLLT